MNPEPSQWEMIFKNDPHLFAEPSPQVTNFTKQILDHDLSAILDIGCGAGRHAVHMVRKGLRVTGMDNSPTALSLTHQWLDKEGLQADLALADMRCALPFETDSFDAVISTQVIHHALLSTVIATAQEITRIVRPQGMIHISVPVRRGNLEDSDENEMIEPNTFAPTSGPEKGLPHHFFSPEEFGDIFPHFAVTELRVQDGKIIILQAVKK